MTKQRSIMVVEDNPDDLALTLAAFDNHNIVNDILVARDGAEALDVLFGPDAQCELPSVVLLDLKLPKISGIEVLKAIRASDRTRFLPVVILTTSSQDEDRMDGYRFGANSYVRKPVEFDRFIEAARLLGLYWVITNEAA
ncbi:MAG: response regulator [Actinomycetota bacterium]|nr:response regulator [Actinomycetota bacterium]